MSESARELFPTSNHDPLPSCEKCNGRGMTRVRGHWSPCICIYVEHSVLSVVAPAVDQAFKDVLGDNYPKSLDDVFTCNKCGAHKTHYRLRGYRCDSCDSKGGGM